MMQNPILDQAFSAFSSNDRPVSFQSVYQPPLSGRSEDRPLLIRMGFSIL
jgi:hypothetical protein